ncbi:leucine-rich repeat-containing protein 56 isoform X1 [Bufo gargarizans]|uniref:leucine-rich repeat-containing protein 56 isoform X1 n=2 Tax=Bufo gargarizans TaxID=30331 RepID=UPI001CF1DE90|nr:leucine-rich repeat-containing protein 56 isoform X1 [Bufo gargarizans]
MEQRRPDTPSVRVLDLGWQGLLNPNPVSREEDETLVDEYLSPSRLKALTGEDNLQEVTTLQMCVDTRERTLGNFGTHMPNLRELKLNNSVIMSIRDLGTSLSHLQVLWMARCSLTDLDGISSFSSLKELYLAYNDLKDLSQVSMLENLEILDLEGNNLDNISELQYLALCSKLTTLTLEGNPICSRPSPEDTESSDYNYCVEVKRLIPQLQYIDDVPADQRNPNTPRTPNQDWLMVLDSLKESAMSIASVDLGRAQRKPSMRPSTAQPVLIRRPHSAPRASSAGRIVTSLPSAEPSDDSPAEDEASDLTHGVGKVICGNPIKALRARKEKLEATHGSSVPPKGFKPEVSFDSVSQRDRDDVFAELKAWREMHHEVLQRIKDERAPQVLTISHSDEEDTDSFSSSSEDEDLEDTWDSGCPVRVSPETSIHSPRSPTAIPLNAGELISPDSPLQPSPPITPCPPVSIGVKSRPNKGADIRARRLLRVYTPSKTTALRAMPTDTCMGDEAFLATDIDDNIIRAQLMIQQTSKPVGELNTRSSSGTGQLENNNSRPILARFISSHQPVIRSSIKTPERPSPPQIIRPVTATGILQRLPNRPTRLTASKSSRT